MKKRWRTAAALVTLAALLAVFLPAGPALAEEGQAGHSMIFIYNKLKTQVPAEIVELQMVDGRETEVAVEGLAADLSLAQTKQTAYYRLSAQGDNKISPAYSKVFAPYTYVKTEALLPDGSSQVLDLLTSTQTSKGAESMVKAAAGSKTPYRYYRKASEKNINTMTGLKVVLKRDLHLAYDANAGQGGRGTADRTETGMLGREVVLPGAADLGLTNADPSLRFVGWNTQADGSGTSYEAGGTYTLSGQPNETTTLYAQWQAPAPLTLSAQTEAGDLNAGDAFTVDLRLAASVEKGACSRVSFGLDYDAGILDLVSVQDAEGTDLADQDGTYSLQTQKAVSLDASGTVVTRAKFRIKDDVTDGTAATVTVKDPAAWLEEAVCPITAGPACSLSLHNITVEFAAASPLELQGPARAYARYNEAGLYSDCYKKAFDLPQVLAAGRPAQAQGYQWQDAAGAVFDPTAGLTESQTVTAVPRTFSWQANTADAQLTDLTGISQGQVTYGKDVTFKLTAPDKKEITAVSYSVGEGERQTLSPDENGVYTIPGNDILGPVTLEVTTQTVSSGSSGHRSAYTLTFETNGGSAIPAIRQQGRSRVDLTSYQPQRADYDFAGWFSDKALTKPAGDSWLLKGNTTLYAAWTEQNKPQPVPDPEPQAEPFDDVTPASWYHDTVLQAADKGLMTGTGTRLFSPDQPMTRAMFAALLYRAQGSPAAPAGCRFKDVDTSAWYGPAVAWAADQGLVRGVSPESFAPDREISREQMAAMILRYAAYRGLDVPAADDLAHFRDRDQVSAWAREDVARAVAAGYLRGLEEDLLAPSQSLTRAQAAAVVLRTGLFD